MSLGQPDNADEVEVERKAQPSANYLLDTNVVSETRRKRPEPRVISFISSLSASQLFLSVLTLGELRKGVEAKRRSDPDAADSLDEWLAGLGTTYEERILDVDTDVADGWGRLAADRPRPVIDTLLASTALVHDLVLVTRNASDVEGTGVELFNPWVDDLS